MYKFFKNIFGNPNKAASSNAPANIKLLQLINDHIKDHSCENYTKVITELTNGDATLFLPVYDRINSNISKWTPAPEGYTIKSGIYFVDELATIAAFTSKETLFAWAQKPIPYIQLLSKTVMEMCEANEVKQIIIDGKLPISIAVKNGE